ncbi:mechanosensitive ion channel [Synechococcus sp. CBW1107]|uniref:mechanosensitive ion channel family protein n=1 Tax=Synechococcus sp. CBW1107 TaxID=2789857 RepID=UPI0018CECA94|nr:mechanosensitive ion channel family protein [Synechococcus sp. CBW1107]QPN57740.1 mechanosensitive ion channel [Synechococcus sp. CBW1107]
MGTPRQRRSAGWPLGLWPRRLAMAVMALMLVLVNPASGFGWAAGGGTDSSAEAGLSARKHWWDLDRARPCGRFWCSVVVSPHIPLGPGEPRIRLAVGGADGASAQDSAARVEARSTAVATSLRELASQLEASVRSAPTPPPSLGAGLWLDRQQKPRHPLTPSLAIATKNNSPVIVLPADEANNTPLVTLITLTEPDSITNGLDTEALAQRWEGILERTLSEALWGASFDRRFPWARATMVALAAAFGAAGVLVCSPAVRRRRQRVLALGRELIELQQSRSTVEEDKALPGEEAIVEAADGQALRQVQQLERVQRHQSLTIKLIRVLRIAVVVMAVILALFVLPGSRLLALALLRQSAWIPVIWLVMIVLEGLLSWSLARRLNQWAEQAQLAEPNSRRPQQRLGTNLGVIKGTIGVGTTLLGLYLTLLLFGLTPEILAGAGIVAVAVGFLARGLVEDLIGGVRILSADLYAVGDSIAANGHAGLVESMNLLYTQLRGGGGELISLPNGAIRECENRSKDWARVNFEVDIAWRSDLARASALMQAVATELAADPEWSALILEEPQLLGVEQLDQSGVRLKLWIKTQPLKQWGVAREYRWRLKLVFDEAGIEPGIPQRLSLQA